MEEQQPVKEILVARDRWRFWRCWIAEAGHFYLYAGLYDQKRLTQALHLGAFTELDALMAQLERFLDEPQTTLVLALDADQLASWLQAPALEKAPRFEGHFGSPWSGYGIRPLTDLEVEVIYAADRRHEWLGVFSEAQAFAYIEQDYDQRRKRCLIC